MKYLKLLSQFQAQLRPPIRAKTWARLFDHSPFVVLVGLTGASNILTRGNINCAIRMVLAGVSQGLLQSVNWISAFKSSKPDEPTLLSALKTSAATHCRLERWHLADSLAANFISCFLNKQAANTQAKHISIYWTTRQ